jgi:hypothetical protein
MRQGSGERINYRLKKMLQPYLWQLLTSLICKSVASPYYVILPYTSALYRKADHVYGSSGILVRSPIAHD